MAKLKSFYDLDYIIELSEKRVEQYTSAYQLVLGRLTNIILIYSALGIYFVSIIQNYSETKSLVFEIAFWTLLIMVIISIFFTIRLLMPAEIAYLQKTNTYYQDLRLEYESRILKSEMTPEEQSEAREKINTLLKASYIDELIRAQDNNQSNLRRKGSFYFRALYCGLIATIPYIVCVGYHTSKKDDKIQKVEIIIPKKA